MARRIDVIKQQIEQGADAFRDGKDKAREAKFAPGGRFTNWSQIGHCNPSKHYRPRSESDVVLAIKEVAGKGGKVRVAGAGASTNSICFTNDAMLHMKEHMNKVISVDLRAQTITVEGGCTLRHIFSSLDAAGLMISCVPSHLDTTIAGSIGTGGHSSGINVKSLHALVVSMRVVTGTGEVRTITKSDHYADWRHWTCHLGVLGVITEVTLQAEKQVLWRRISAPIAASKVRGILPKRVADNEYYRFWWTPHTDMCFEATVRPVAAVDDEHDATKAGGDLEAPGRHVSGNPFLQVGDASLDKERVNAIATALRDPHSSHQLWDQHRSEQQLIADAANRILPEPVNPVAIPHHVLERALYAATFTPSLQPAVNQAYQRTILNDVQEQYGTAADVMACDALFRQHSAEWAVDAKDALEAYDCVRRIVTNNNLKVHFPVEFTFVDADDTTLSPCKGRKTCYVKIVMYRPMGREAPDTARFLELFSTEMRRMGGRPHWGKYYRLNTRDMAELYGAADWEAFNQYRTVMDPKGVFVNEWYSNLLSSI